MEQTIKWHPYPKEKPDHVGALYIITYIGMETGKPRVSTGHWCRLGFGTDVIAWAELPKPYEEGAEK